MLLEIILYFTLGFLAAILLVLLVAPTIWNRAVVLTKRKVESTLPLSLNEIQAEKDRLRAEYAMTSRRLELGIEDLRKQASKQVIELHKKRDEANRLNKVHKEDMIKIEGLEKAAESMRTKLEENHERIESLDRRLAETSKEFSTLKESDDELRKRHSETQEELNKTKIELVAKETRIDSLSGTLSTLDLTDEERTLKIQELNDEIIDLKEAKAAEAKQSKELTSELKAVQRKLQSTEKKLEKQTTNTKANTEKEAALQAEVSELTNKLISENARVIELEASLAQQILRDEIITPAKRTGVKTFENLNEENEALVEDVKAAAKEDSEEDQEALKSRLRDMAAKTAITKGFTPVGMSNGKGKTDNPANQSDKPSLVERIKALQNEDATDNG
ncbi:MAG: hypothetical protein AAGA53_10700 [Pseudomonadota bacterium]